MDFSRFIVLSVALIALHLAVADAPRAQDATAVNASPHQAVLPPLNFRNGIDYPYTATRTGLEGKALAEFNIAADGRVFSPTIIFADDPEFKFAVEELLADAQFDVRDSDGAALPKRYRLGFVFCIPRSGQADSFSDTEYPPIIISTSRFPGSPMRNPIYLPGNTSKCAQSAGENAQQSVPFTRISASSVIIRTVPAIDKQHPLKVGDYPIQSRRVGEQGICVTRVQVNADGKIRAAQLAVSSGFPRLDATCLNSFLGQILRPTTVNGKPVTSWTNIPSTFRIKGDYRTLIAGDPLETPHLANSTSVKVGPDYYPESSRKARQQGTCQVHLKIDETGMSSDFSLTKSTGFAALDNACIEAVQGVRFVPAQDGTSAIAKWTDVLIDWRLP